MNPEPIPGRRLNLANIQIENWVVTRDVGQSANGNRQWELVHECGATVRRDTTSIVAYMAGKFMPRCRCQRSVKPGRKCHREHESELGCRLCAGLPWRVVGVKCRRCGLAFREEQITQAQAVIGSTAARWSEFRVW